MDVADALGGEPRRSVASGEKLKPMQCVRQRIPLRDEIGETDHEDFFRWRNLEDWNYYDEPESPSNS